MKRRKWKPEQKALIVLEGLKGRPIGDLCAEHEISQAQYYQWRDQFLANAAKAFEPAGAPQRQGRLERENAGLKNLVGQATLELNKSQEIPGQAWALRQGRRAQPTLLERIRDLKAEPVLGLPPDLGAPALRRRPERQSEAGLRRHEGGRPPGAAEPQASRPTQGRHDQAQADPTEPSGRGIDMTKVMIEGFGWIYLVVVLDWHTKKVVGHYAGMRARAWHWLVALNGEASRGSLGSRRKPLEMAS